MRSSVALAALAVSVAARVPVLLWGSPGTGKTSAVLALGDALGWPVETVIGSIREPSDFAGLPVVADGSVRLSPPGWAARLTEAGEGLLFLDELTTAPPAVQAAMLRVVLERVVGDVRLPYGVRVVAAANPPDEAADGWELAAPLANRLVHLDWPVDGKAVARLLAACAATGASDAVQAVLVEGAVGDGAALEFLAWLEHLDLPDPDEVLADPDAFVLPERSDRAFAVLTAVAAVAMADGTGERWEQAWRVVARAADGAPDVAALVARTLAENRPEGAEVPEALLALAPVLRAAGLLG